MEGKLQQRILHGSCRDIVQCVHNIGYTGRLEINQLPGRGLVVVAKVAQGIASNILSDECWTSLRTDTGSRAVSMLGPYRNSKKHLVTPGAFFVCSPRWACRVAADALSFFVGESFWSRHGKQA